MVSCRRQAPWDSVQYEVFWNVSGYEFGCDTRYSEVLRMYFEVVAADLLSKILLTFCGSTRLEAHTHSARLYTTAVSRLDLKGQTLAHLERTVRCFARVSAPLKNYGGFAQRTPEGPYRPCIPSGFLSCPRVSIPVRDSPASSALPGPVRGDPAFDPDRKLDRYTSTAAAVREAL